DVHASLLSFDAFGKRRNVDWSDTPNGTDQYSPSSRGNLDYTGHEAITEVGLIHMNGRVYDPGLGVFLSADPNIQSASMSQNYHRYSYVLNNPLKYNDPSGYFFSMVVALVVSATIEQIAVQMVAIAIASLMETKGDLRTALVTAVSAGVAYGIGSIFQNAAKMSAAASIFGKAFAHGLTQAFFSQALGGDFRSGFVGGFLGSATGRLVPKGVVVGTLISAMIGGTISALTGGKFRNGARSAAIVHLFNQLQHDWYRDPSNSEVRQMSKDITAAIDKKLNELQKISLEDWVTEYGQDKFSGANLNNLTVRMDIEAHMIVQQQSLGQIRAFFAGRSGLARTADWIEEGIKQLSTRGLEKMFGKVADRFNIPLPDFKHDYQTYVICETSQCGVTYWDLTDGKILYNSWRK
ncbi:MAG TPA: RHS repeat-associated core domain-containing protein, partial [Gammaproteobacteria bacterium]